MWYNVYIIERMVVMKIQAVLIDGFKNLSNVRISFENITALVAINNFGKSNVLKGIDFGLKFMKESTEDKLKLMANSDLIPTNKNMIGKNYKFEIEVLTNWNKEEYRLLYGYEFAWTSEKEPYIVSEYLKMKLDQKRQKYSQLIIRDEHQAMYKSSDKGRCSSTIKVEKTELLINKLKAYDELYYIKLIKKINSMKFYMEDNLDVKSFYYPDPIIFRGFDNMTVDAGNLPRVIYQLSQKYPNKFELLKNVYKNLFPNIEDIIVKEIKIDSNVDNIIPDDIPFVLTDAIYVLGVKDRNLIKTMDFQMMSDGAKRVFMILTRILLASDGNISLIAIEEPENSVHPNLFHSYIQIISQLLEDCKIIITSHSPYVVNYLDPSWIHIGMSKTPGIAEFFTFKKSGQRLLQQDANDFKMSMGDYLFSMLADEESNWEDYLECSGYE